MEFTGRAQNFKGQPSAHYLFCDAVSISFPEYARSQDKDRHSSGAIANDSGQ